MKIEVRRQACCAQDDQLGPLVMFIDVSHSTRVWELAKKIGESGFLQFSGTHSLIDVLCKGVHLFSIPVIGRDGGVVKYAVEREGLAFSYLEEPKIECVWPSGL